MRRKRNDAERGVCALVIIFFMGITSCIMVYRYLNGEIWKSFVDDSSAPNLVYNGAGDFESGEEHGECCRGVDHLELWGGTVKWGADFKLNSSRECCLACKSMNLCNSWVFCGDTKACGARFGEV